ncbi:MAG: HEAT repeat domain-containing protein [Nitrospiraceae bacterium]
MWMIVQALILIGLVSGCHNQSPDPDLQGTMNRLIRLAEDRDPEVRLTTVVALGRIGKVESNPILLQRLQDNDGRVRQWSAWALGTLNLEGGGSPETMNSLVASLSDPVSTVRQAASQALSELNQDQGTARRLLPALQSSNSGMRRAAARALIGQATVDILPTLVGVSGDQDVEVRQAVVAALGELGDARAIPPLLARLTSDPAAPVRAEAAFRLGKIGTADVIEPLQRAATNDGDGQVRRWAAAAVESVRSGSGSG